MYNVHHTTILHHWRKYTNGEYNFVLPTEEDMVGVKIPLPKSQYTLVVLNKKIPQQWYIDFNGEKIYLGKSYKQIREEAAQRRKLHPVVKAEFPVNFRGRNLF